MRRVSAWISVLGLLNYDATVFDDFHIPEGLNHDILVDNIVAEYAELEVIYPNPPTFKRLLGSWSSMRLPVWQHLYDTTMYKYDALNPYNMNSKDSSTGKKTNDSISVSQSAGEKDIDASDETVGQERLKGGIESVGTDTTDDTGHTSDNYIGNTSDEGTESRTDKTVYSESASGDEKGNTKDLTKGNDAVTATDQTGTYVYGYNSADKALRESVEGKNSSTDEWNTDATGNHDRDWRKTENDTTDVTSNKTNNLTRWERTGNETDSTGKTTNENTKTTDENRTTDSYSLLQRKNKTTEVGKEENAGSSVDNTQLDSKGERLGNTGIYTKQMLIQQEREVAEFSLYQYIMRDFKKRFCIQVW